MGAITRPLPAASVQPSNRRPAGAAVANSAAAAPVVPKLPAPEQAVPQQAVPQQAVPEAITAEQALVQAAQQGDRQAFATLVQQHQGAVYGYLRARLLEPADAEDLSQEVFLRCLMEREKLQRATVPRAWLIGIARNLLREHARRCKRRREVAWTELCLDFEELNQADLPEHGDVLGSLDECLQSLGQSARQALDLHYHACMRLAEIAHKLHRSVGAVKLLMYRARQALKHCLNRKLENPCDDRSGTTEAGRGKGARGADA